MFLPQLDSEYLVGTSVSNCVTSAGLIKITTSSAHGLSTGNKVIVTGLTGTTEGNGMWTITVTSTTEFTLDSSTFTNTWGGGGYIYTRGHVISIKFDTTTPASATVDCCVKYISSGSVNDGDSLAFAISSSSLTYDIAVASASYLTAIHSIKVMNNEAGATTLTPRIFRRTLASNTITSYNLVRMSLAQSYSALVGGDGVLSLYKDTGLPYVS